MRIKQEDFDPLKQRKKKSAKGGLLKVNEKGRLTNRIAWVGDLHGGGLR